MIIMRFLQKVKKLFKFALNATRLRHQPRSVSSHSNQNFTWVPIFVCYDIPCALAEARVFGKGISAKCPTIKNIPIFTCIKQAHTHSQYLKQGSSVLKIMVPECRIIAVNDKLKLRPLLIHPELIAGYYQSSVNQALFVKNPNFNQKLFIPS